MFNNTILGVIYLIKHKTCDDKKVYIGSTINLKQRIWQHKKACNNEKYKEYNYNLYKYIRDNDGINMYEFIILECYVCNFKYELYDREDDYIQMYDNNLNTFRAYLTGREIKEINKKYREDNKEKIKEIKKKYYDENKEKIKEKISEKITCECGSIVSKHHMTRHRRSLKHIAYTEKK